MKVHLMIIAMLILLLFWGKGQHNYNPTNDGNKLLNYFGHQQALLKKNDSCPECSHIETKVGARFPAVSSASRDVFEFEDGGLFDKGDSLNQFRIAAPLYLNSASGVAPVPAEEK
ncbi:hypothetical protein [Chitinophaga polysaccharea]|uniref:hypothetical protein n=1 Tax=Chitinophaga polysaccharea TaxID=1293035 RepID=UPI001159130D|nr:hypothetical protein [Chitinophaga polysaccharea]